MDKVNYIISRLEDKGFQSYIVGGAVRDKLMGKEIEDWDIATSARPKDVMAIFEKTVTIGVDHGTVGVVIDGELFEVTTFRKDVETFGRRAIVSFVDTIKEDLSRRDFTINGIAWHPKSNEIIDPFHGRQDITNELIRAIGSPHERFKEDFLRMLRAIRFACQFEFDIETETWEAIRNNAKLINKISAERIRDEIMKMLERSKKPSRGFLLLKDSGLLKQIMPEVEAMFGVEQNRFHSDDVGTHSLLAMDRVDKRYPFLRLVTLLHDVGKPPARTWNEAKNDYNFFGHEKISKKITKDIFRRLRFSNEEIELGTHLVANHMRLFDEDGKPAAVRRWIRRIGEKNIKPMFRIHFADRGSNRKKENYYSELKQLYRMIRNVRKEDVALRVTDLAINGEDLKEVGLQPSPMFSRILDELLERVTDNPELNTREKLLGLVKELIPTISAKQK